MRTIIPSAEQLLRLKITRPSPVTNASPHFVPSTAAIWTCGSTSSLRPPGLAQVQRLHLRSGLASDAPNDRGTADMVPRDLFVGELLCMVATRWRWTNKGPHPRRAEGRGALPGRQRTRRAGVLSLRRGRVDGSHARCEVASFAPLSRVCTAPLTVIETMAADWRCCWTTSARGVGVLVCIFITSRTGRGGIEDIASHLEGFFMLRCSSGRCSQDITP